MKACHEGIGVLISFQGSSDHFGRDKMGTMVVTKWYFPYIFTCVTELLSTWMCACVYAHTNHKKEVKHQLMLVHLNV